MVQNETENEQIDKVKAIGNYKLFFKSSFDKRKEDLIFLNIALSDDLKELLKTCVIDEKIDISYLNGRGTDGHTYAKLKRYKVKTWIFSSLYANNKDLLFLVNLIDDGNINIPFSSTDYIESTISSYRDNLKRLLEVVLKYSKLDVNVNFNIEK